jgi:motility quorum-sensing regulator/GCU-specific mRNA interferase toxin
MTTHNDHTLWQDVYHAPCPNGQIAYVKVTLRAGAVVIQFKEK